MALTTPTKQHIRAALANNAASNEVINVLDGESQLEIQDDTVLGLGDDSDQALASRSTALNANTALASVLVGTPAVAAIPANSLIVSNVTADGDQVFVTRPAAGANSIEWLRNDASAGITVFNEASGDIDFRIESNALSNFMVIDANTCLNGQVAFGGAVPTNPQAFFAILPAVNATGVTADQSYFHAQLLPGAATVIPTGTAAVAASLNVHEPNLTATGTITEAATVRIVDAPTEGGLNMALWVDAGITRLDGTTYIGDTVNANVTLGLTINQGAADDQILALKSSDVAHAATTLAEADSYGTFAKHEPTTGGLHISGFKDADGAVLGNALVLRGVLDETAADTTKSTAAVGIVAIVAGIEATNTIGAAGANENLVVITDGAGATQFIFDAEGSLHGNAAVAEYDAYDDVSLVRAYDHGKKGFIRNQWDSHVTANRQNLLDLGIIGQTTGINGERALVNQTKLTQLHNGAIWQLFSDLMELASVLPPEVQAKLPERIRGKLALAQ